MTGDPTSSFRVPVEEPARLISDPSVSGETLRALAARRDVDPRFLTLLAVDEARIKQQPEIAAAIYANPRAPLSVANGAILTCRRVGVSPDGIPGFEDLARAILEDPAAVDPAAVDAGFDALLSGAPDAAPEAGIAGEPDAAGDRGEASVDAGHTTASSPTAPPVVDAKKATGRKSATIDFGRLKLYEKIRLATLGNAYCRQNLLRDSNRMVAMAAIRSPQITDGEIAKAAGNRALSEDVIRYISNRKELVKQYPVKLALVGNAKCPLAVALRLLPSLYPDDIKQLARSKNVPGALSVAAKRLAAARGPQ